MTPSKSAEALKPCPHCEDEKPDKHDGGHKSEPWVVCCRTTYCGARISAKTDAEVVEAWNRRPARPTAPSSAEVEEAWSYLADFMRSNPMAQEAWIKVRAEYARLRQPPAQEDGLREALEPVLRWLNDRICPSYGHSGGGDNQYIDKTKPERDHFIGNSIFLDEIHMIALAINALTRQEPKK